MKKLPSSFILLSRIIFTPLGLLLGGILGSSILENTDFLDGILANVPSPGLFNVIFIICCAVVIGVILFFYRSVGLSDNIQCVRQACA